MNTTSIRAGDNGPWYLQPWPWLLMSGPAIAIFACFSLAWQAVKTNDGLVSEDYYKKGLAANHTILQSERAVKSGLQAGVVLSAERITVRLRAMDGSFVLPASLTMTVSHPTRAGLDQTRTMKLVNGTYSAEFHLPAAGHWLILLNDEAQSWRLMGKVLLPAAGEIQIGAGDIVQRGAAVAD